MRKVLTTAQMNAIDRKTIAAGIPGIVLMENAAHRVVEYLERHYTPLHRQRIAILCGKGNNGGDGIAIARQLQTRFAPDALWVVLLCDPASLTGDAALNLQMLQATGVPVHREFIPELPSATLVIDAILGTGLRGPATGLALEGIRKINTAFPGAAIVAVDIPSGLAGDTGIPEGEFVRADATVTFTAPKICHAVARNLMGDLVIAPIGTPPAIFENDADISLSLITPAGIAELFAPRDADGNKGRYGHVLIVAGARGKSGAAAMAGLAALRAGAGLVTVACPESALETIAAIAPELMTSPLAETATGTLALSSFDEVQKLASTRTLTAIGPGLGTDAETQTVVRRLFAELQKPLILDADALNCIAGTLWPAPTAPRILTPHPGEMSRLAGKTIPEIQTDRLNTARAFATSRHVTLVLKGEGTLIAFPDGRVWINPTGSPAMATAGTGDILTGMTAGLAAQFPNNLDQATAAAVYLHGLAGELTAAHLGEQPVIATDLLRYFPEGIRAIRNIPHAL